MNPTCFVCNNTIEANNAVNIFSESVSSGTTLAVFLGVILEQNVSQLNVNSQIICNKCHKLCTEYQSMQNKLQETKTKLLKLFKNTQTSLQISSNTCSNSMSITPQTNSEMEKPKVRLVLPSTKLQPLPPNYVINVDKLNLCQRKSQMVSISSSHLGTPNTNAPTFFHPVQIIAPYSVHQNDKIATSVDPNSLITIGNKIRINNDCDKGKKVTNVKTKCSKQKGSRITITDPLANTPTKESSMVSFEANTLLPKDFLDSDRSSTKQEGDSSEDLDDDQELPMEIDEDCAYVQLPDGDSADTNNEGSTETSPNYVTIKALTNSSESVLNTVKLLEPQSNDTEDTDEDQQTIVMQDENGSLLQMKSGQKLVYSGGSLMLMSSDQDDDGDGNDSNEESQIELQVSDDDETAKAIIAAAKEQGGAFIKVESGELFRVTSVKSQVIKDTEDSNETTTMDMVKEKNGRFTCLLCVNLVKGQKSEFFNAENMMQHLKNKHNARLYICWVCNSMFRRRAELISHQQTHAASHVDLKTRQYVCNVCNKKYNSRTLLQEHMNVHSGRRPYICSFCEKTFASKYTHQAHLKTHSVRPRPFKCDQCPKAFLNQQNLAQHEKTHLGIKDFVCNTCGKAFATQHNLEVHHVVHLGMKPYACDTCGKGFARRNEVKDHMRIHTGERPFACDICGVAFSQRSNLATHIRATHLNESRYNCTQCPKKFKRRRLLDYHVKATHTGERPLVCEICKATFVYPEHYRKHQRIHSGEKPYDCEVCGKTFNSRDNRNTHRFIHSDKKPYECLVCGTGYMRKQLLYAHMNTSGHLAESIVVNQPRVQKIANTRGDKFVEPESIFIEPFVEPESHGSSKEPKKSLGSSTKAPKKPRGLELVPDSEGHDPAKIYLTKPDGDSNYVVLDVDVD